MAKIIRFDQVNESGFDWKSFISRNKKYTINDLYIKNTKPTEKVNKPSKGEMILGYSFQDLERAKDLEFGYLDSGVFRKTKDYFRTYRFGNFKEGEIWLDFSAHHDKLKDISINKLSLKVGQEVFIKSLEQNGNIEEISPLVIYKIYDEVFKKGIDSIITLAYKVNGKWYQATKLEVIKSSKKISIVDEEIEDNFLEFIDTNQLTFSSKFFIKGETSGYECKISISLKTPEILDQISSRLLVLSKRLSNYNIDFQIKSISLEGVVFLTTQR